MNLTKFVSSSIEEGRRILKVLRLGRSDVQTANEAVAFGIDSVPLRDLRAIYANTGQSGTNVIIGYISLSQVSVEGETRLYALDPSSGNKSIDIILRTDGTMEVGGDADFMVRYSALETAYNELRDDFNSFISTYNSHTHPAPGGTTSPATQTGSTSAGDITGARIDEIKTI